MGPSRVAVALSLLAVLAAPVAAEHGSATYAIFQGQEAVLFGFNFLSGGSLSVSVEAVDGNFPVSVGLCTADQLADSPGCPTGVANAAINFTEACGRGKVLTAAGQTFSVTQESMPAGPALLVVASCSAPRTTLTLTYSAVNPGGMQLSAGNLDAYVADITFLCLWTALGLAAGVAFACRRVGCDGCRIDHPLASAWASVAFAQTVATAGRVLYWAWENGSGEQLVLPPVFAGTVTAAADGATLALLLSMCLGFGVVRWSLMRSERQLLLFLSVCLTAVQLTGLSGGGLVSGVLTCGVMAIAFARAHEFSRVTCRYLAFVADAFALSALASPTDAAATRRAGSLWKAAGTAHLRTVKHVCFASATLLVWAAAALCATWPPMPVAAVGDAWMVPVLLSNVLRMGVSAWTLLDVLRPSPLLPSPGGRGRRRSGGAGPACIPEPVRGVLALCCGTVGRVQAGGAEADGEGDGAGRPLLRAARVPSAKPPAPTAQPDYAVVAAPGSRRAWGLGVSPSAAERLLHALRGGSAEHAARATGAEGAAAAVAEAAGAAADTPVHHAGVARVARHIVDRAGPGNPLLALSGGQALLRLASVAAPDDADAGALGDDGEGAAGPGTAAPLQPRLGLPPAMARALGVRPAPAAAAAASAVKDALP